MLALEVLQSYTTQWDALLVAIGSMDSSSLLEKFNLSKFNLSDVKICLTYHVALKLMLSM